MKCGPARVPRAVGIVLPQSDATQRHMTRIPYPQPNFRHYYGPTFCNR